MPITWRSRPALGQQPDAGAQAIAREMRALRPQLFEGQTTQLDAKENASNNNSGSSMPEGTT